MVDSNSKAILELLKKPGNNVCADCGSTNPEYASYNIGIFVCTRCAEIHRGLGVHISQVKHLKLDRWEDSQRQRMQEIGNRLAKSKYEKSVPPCYRVPLEDDPLCLIEEWICGKYVREEFVGKDKAVYMSGYMEEFLMKRCKEDPKYYPRKFILSEEEDTIKYYVHETKEPKGVIKVSKLSVSFAPEKMEKKNSLQLSFMRDNSTRHLFLYHQDPQTIVNWYNGIRCVQLHVFRLTFPSASQHELQRMLPRDYKEGWLSKTGPRPTDAYKRRWFTLDRRKLMYHEEPLSALAKGEIWLGNEGFSVSEGVPSGAKDQGYSFTLYTPDRWYYLSAETALIRDSWIQALQQVLVSPLTSLDHEVAARMLKKRGGTSGLNIFSPR